MSRVPKWKVEKAKMKVVFRLQFHATHIPQPGWDKLFVSFIPVDTGKATAKTTKANVRNGNCKWSDPIYETTRLLQDIRSRKYDEKLYKLVVAMGSSRSSLLGEVAINLAEFADASKPSSISLPLHSCEYGTVLHVTVQLLTSKTGFREFEQQRELSVKGLHTLSGQRSYVPAVTATTTSEMTSEQLDKVNNVRVRFKEDSTGLPSLEEVGESNEDYEDSAAGLDGSSNTSESLYAEKNEISSMHEVDSLKSMASGDINALPAAQSPRIAKHEIRDIRLSKQGSNDWTHGWSSDYSADNDLTTAYEENNRLRVRLEGVEAAFLQLKTEAKSLQNLSDELGAETHNLTKQLALELASGKNLTAEVSILKSECYKFKKELEELKSAAAMHCISGNKTPFHGTMKIQATDALFTEQNSFSNQHQAKWLQGLLLLEDKIREIQNKACLRFCGNDFDFLSSDFDVLQCILDNVRQETSSELVEETQFKEMQLTRVLQSEHFIHRQGMEGSYVDHHHHPDGMLHSSINSQPLKKNIDATSVLEEKMCQLLQKLEESDVEKGILTKKMDQMECYYEALIQELEESRHQVANEFENLKTEHSSCLYTISALQSQVEKLQQDMNEQFIRFAGDRHDLDSLNKELEEKAIASETALKRVRLNYAIAVDRLQKDLELLSFQVLSMYETNENLAKQALLDASQLFPHQNPEIHPDEQYKPGIAKFHLETISRIIDHEKSPMVNGISGQASLGTIHNFDFNRENKNIFQRGLSRNVDTCTKDEGSNCSNLLKVENIERSLRLKSAEEERDLVFCNEQKNGFQGGSPIFEATYDFQSQNVESSNQLLGNVGSKETRSSLDMLQKLQVDTETELSQMHMLNMHWEVFTEVLKEAIHNLNDGVMHMKEEMVKLARQLKDSTSEKELLMLNLQSAFDDVRKLRKDEANCRSKCDDLMSKNYILEARIGDVSRENSSLVQKVAEYQNKYKSCLEEKNEFEDMLKTESLQTSSLQNEIRSTVEDFKALKEGFDNQSSAYSELRKTMSYLQKKLGDLCHNVVSFSEEIDGIAVDGLSLKQEMESNNYMAIFLHLEQFQQEACKKVLQLHQEKKEIEKDRDITHCSLNNTEAEILNVKQRFESDLEETRMRLDLSNALVEKLKRELQDVADKLKFSLEIEERHKSTNKELSSELAILEIEIQQANDEKRDITQKLLEFDNVKEELEQTKLSLMDCMQENRALMVSIESGKVVSTRLENELINLKEGLKCAHDNLNVERGSREELEAAVADLILQLEDKGRQLLSCVKQKSELIFLSQRVTDLETEMQQFLLNSKECQRIFDDEISTLHLHTADLEYYLVEFLDQSLSADVKVTYLRCQCQLMMEELVDQNKAVHGELEELHLKHTDLVASVKDHIAIEAQFADENARSSTALQSVKAELEAIVREKEGLLGYINEKSSVLAGFEDMEARVVMLEADNSREKKKYEDEICQLRNMMVSLEEEVDSVRSSNVELETTEIILKSKLDEQLSRISLLEECEHELTRSREQHTELTYKLSEQSLKTEEFKNLSIHLRELKDKADAECLQARERREAEGSSLATQDSLRIAFIKEQCESKLQEMKTQLCASKKYAEEMLLKLQTALDEVETGKRSEASLAKRNEELSVKISDMEAELLTVVTDRRELVKALDRMKAELECTILSLDCCKEEKLKLEASLQECSEERTRLRVELDLVKRLLENMASFTGNVKAHKNQPGWHSTTSIGEILEDDNFQPSVYQEMPNAVVSCSDEGAAMGDGEDPINNINRVKLEEMNPMLSLSREAKDIPPACGSGNSLPTLQQNLPDHQDELVTRSSIDKEALLENSTKHIADIKEHFKEQQRLLTSMDLLHKELERLKNDNLSSVIPLENHHLDPALQGLQSDFSQLDKANEHLGSIFPTFKEIPGSGNPLERVLALELELAESLRAKKKDICFQSSFLKQHNDDEAVFKSFRDINDLIQDMLELKRRNAAVETELKEMQGRYSQLSLQFAEVEGERQQLVMTLKNRSPRKS